MSDIYLSLTETPAVVTLSQPVISGALSSTVTVANTVTVALDANSLSALEQVTVTVGAAVSVSNFPATQTVAGTVTVGNSVTIGSLPAIAGTVTVGNTVTVAGTVTANPTGTQTIAGTVTASLADVVADDAFHGVPHVRVNGGSGLGVELAGIDVGGGILSIHEGGGIPVYPRDNVNENAPFPVAGTVMVGNTVTVAGTVTANPTGTQTVAGTVTANVPALDASGVFGGNVIYGISGEDVAAVRAVLYSGDFGSDGGHVVGPYNPLPIAGTVTVGNTVTVAGTVTANPAGTQTVAGTVTIGNTVTVAGTVTANPTGTQTIAGTVTANLNPQLKGPIIEIDSAIPADPKYVAIVGGFDGVAGESRALKLGSSGEIVVGQLPAISGTVTVGNLPRGALTTRFGSVTTAGTAQLTSAVTNASRKYLLLQNISTGAVTVGVGFVPTTTQGIALAAGAGLTFDAFCPTGAVHWLGATTGAAFTILEG
jgi:hypothetical protein